MHALVVCRKFPTWVRSFKPGCELIYTYPAHEIFVKKQFHIKEQSLVTNVSSLFVTKLHSLPIPRLVATPAENLKLPRTFVQWMEEHANFRTVCEDGKGNCGQKGTEDREFKSRQGARFLGLAEGGS
jgi:hypothetical protein